MCIQDDKDESGKAGEDEKKEEDTQKVESTKEESEQSATEEKNQEKTEDAGSLTDDKVNMKMYAFTLSSPISAICLTLDW